MPATVYSAATIGLDGVLVEVETDVLQAGLHAFTLVGLPDTAIREARDRVSAAIKNCGFEPPHHSGRVTVNLAPADLQKNSSMYDLPIALAFLKATGQLEFESKQRMFVGELSLDGSVRRVSGVLSIALFAKHQGFEELYVPAENAREAALVGGIAIIPVPSLFALARHLRGQEALPVFVLPDEVPVRAESPHDFKFIRGQEHAKRALEIAAAGGHNVLFVGPPGSGKTLLARALSSILPDLDFDERLEVTKIYSVAGRAHRSEHLMREQPFRSPHHTASAASLIGGGSVPKPGEISLAHRGVLFLDEFAEFSRAVLENLREPLEEGTVTVSRVRGSLAFPARFLLVAAMNPCPCGYAGDPEHACSCSPYQVLQYKRKISGPILDRIDLHVDVPRVKLEKLQESFDGAEPSEMIRGRVASARDRQRDRMREWQKKTNAEMDTRLLERFCALDQNVQAFLLQAAQSFKLSARGYGRVLKVARTIADLAGEERIGLAHVTEALQYRFRD